MFVEPFLPFLLFILAVYATPGPATLSIAASAASFGVKKSTPYILGVVVGLMLVFLMISFGLAILYTKYPTFQLIFKWASLLYIIYLAYRIATAKSIGSNNSKQLGFVEAIPINFLNPKAYFAITSTISQFTKPGEEYYSSLVILVIWVLIFALIIDFGWGFIGQFLSSKITSAKISNKVNLGFATLLVVSVLATLFL